MTKAESERSIRALVRQWAKIFNIAPSSAEMPSFDDFRSWLQREGYSGYLNFRSTMGAYADAGQWFDEELGQTWRN